MLVRLSSCTQGNFYLKQFKHLRFTNTFLRLSTSAYRNTRNDEDEEDMSKPFKYTRSPAHLEHKAYQSFRCK